MTDNLTLNSTVVISPNQLAAQLNGEVIILNMQSGTYFGLDEVAARIWSLVQKPVTCAEVLATLFAEYEVEHSQLEGDVMRFVHNLHKIDLLDVQ